MTKVSVIIPYFQRTSGILRRALVSVLQQQLPPGVFVDVIVIDDGSPVPASEEIEGLLAEPPFALRVWRQPNGGVARARNAGLADVDESSTYIAFLDSDDIWANDHLTRAIAALDTGYDFYFTNNRRLGHHESHFAAWCSALLTIAGEFAEKRPFYHISKATLVSLVITQFPTQASCVVFRKHKLGNIRFPEFLHFAGEDVVFFASLIAGCDQCCFAPDDFVTCADGINMYFNNFAWDSPAYMRIKLDQIRTFLHLSKTAGLGAEHSSVAVGVLAEHRRQFVFQVLRRFIKDKGRLPAEALTLAREDEDFWFWFSGYVVVLPWQLVVGRFRPR